MVEKSTELAARPAPINEIDATRIMFDQGAQDALYRYCRIMADSGTIPARYAGKPADIFVVAQFAIRAKIEPMMALQNMYVVNGNPGMEAKLAIALANASGVFSGPIQYVFSGAGDSLACRAFAIERSTGRQVVGPTVSVEMAKKLKWWDKNQNWQHATELMLSYRAASWMIRVYHPEATMGIPLADELLDAPDSIPATAFVPIDGDHRATLSGYFEAMRNGDEEQAQKIIGPGNVVEKINGKWALCRIVAATADEPPPVPQPSQPKPITDGEVTSITGHFHKLGFSDDDLVKIVGRIPPEWTRDDVDKLRKIAGEIKSGATTREKLLGIEEPKPAAPDGGSELFGESKPKDVKRSQEAFKR